MRFTKRKAARTLVLSLCLAVFPACWDTGIDPSGLSGAFRDIGGDGVGYEADGSGFGGGMISPQYSYAVYLAYYRFGPSLEFPVVGVANCAPGEAREELTRNGVGLLLCGSVMYRYYAPWPVPPAQVIREHATLLYCREESGPKLELMLNDDAGEVSLLVWGRRGFAGSQAATLVRDEDGTVELTTETMRFSLAPEELTRSVPHLVGSGTTRADTEPVNVRCWQNFPPTQ